MPDHRHKNSQRLKRTGNSQKSGQEGSRPAGYAVRPVKGEDAWELTPPPEAQERAADLDEARAMIDAGEFEIARDELLWLLEGYHDLLDAHRLLGELALEESNATLGRAHFGYAFQLGVDALPGEDFAGPLPYRLPANQSFLESGKGLIWCLKELGKLDLARDVLEKMLRLDPSDPLGVGKMLSPAAGSEESATKP